MLEDVGRIEVVRGPGGTLWGANAVNGVINIITKSAGDTQRGLIATGAGSEETGFASMRYGFSMSDGHDLRLYGKWLERDSGFVAGDNNPDDESRFAQAGLRYDGALSDHDSITLQLDSFDGKQGSSNELISPDTSTSGSNLLGRWKRELNGGGQTSLQFYYDKTDYDFIVLQEQRDTFSIEFQHHLAQSERSKTGASGIQFQAIAIGRQNNRCGTHNPLNRNAKTQTITLC